jgi:hypothetical protein
MRKCVGRPSTREPGLPRPEIAALRRHGYRREYSKSPTIKQSKALRHREPMASHGREIRRIAFACDTLLGRVHRSDMGCKLKVLP